MKATSGGSSESEAKDWQANPAGPAASSAVMTVTPLANCPRTRRNSARVDRRPLVVPYGPKVRPGQELDGFGGRGGADGPEVSDDGGRHPCVSHHISH